MCICQEESLFRSKSVDLWRSRFSFHRFLKGSVGDVEAAQISNGFADHQLTFHVKSLFNFKTAELINDALGGLQKRFSIVFCPPVWEVTLGVKLSALIIEAMCQLVPNNRSHTTVINGIISGRIEKRRLKNSSGKNYLVELGIVPGVNRLRRYYPFQSVDWFAYLA